MQKYMQKYLQTAAQARVISSQDFQVRWMIAGIGVTLQMSLLRTVESLVMMIVEGVMEIEIDWVYLVRLLSTSHQPRAWA